MTARQRLLGLLLILVLVIAVQAGQHAYRWFAFSGERAQLDGMRESVVDAGVEVVRTEARADTLHDLIAREDQELEAKRRTVEAYGRYARDGTLAGHLYDAYRTDIAEFNARVEARNSHANEYREMIARNRAAVDRYNLLADSIRGIAARIGDPYYPIPLPVEAAAERGLLDLEEAGRSGTGP